MSRASGPHSRLTRSTRRPFALFLVLAAALFAFLFLLASSQGATRRRPAHVRGPSAPTAQVTVRLPAGWHFVPKRLTDTTYPIPLMVASFHVRARSTCSCGVPRITDFPRDGAFLFAWQYTHLAPAARRYFPPRRAGFHVPRSSRGPYRCGAPGWRANFRVGQSAFQVQVYLGPEASRGAIAKTDALLESIRVTSSR